MHSKFPSRNSQKAYAAAGVDIDMAESLLAKVKPALRKASRPESLGAIGGFGGFFDISRLKLKQPVLVASTDSVGTKVTAARIADEYRFLGADIVNHCANDVAVCGAEPLFFLDYYATGQLSPHFVTLLKGLAKACVDGNIALVGGETAELPGVYAEGECDLVGTIVGAVERDRILSGTAIQPGDVLIGLPSSGLHTNGFSLARKVLFNDLHLAADDPLPGFRTTVRKALMAPHRNYAAFILQALQEFNRAKSFSSRRNNAIFGCAHITGGGFTGNIPRILPQDCNAIVDTTTWKPLPIFKTIVEGGHIPADEAYEVFNMGIGMVLVAHPKSVEAICALANACNLRPTVIGSVTAGNRRVTLQH